jgi:hypothetical protein
MRTRYYTAKSAARYGKYASTHHPGAGGLQGAGGEDISLPRPPDVSRMGHEWFAPGRRRRGSSWLASPATLPPKAPCCAPP